MSCIPLNRLSELIILIATMIFVKRNMNEIGRPDTQAVTAQRMISGKTKDLSGRIADPDRDDGANGRAGGSGADRDRVFRGT